MTKLLTKEELQLMFQQSKQRKLKEKQLKKEQKKQQYKELCREADKLLKKEAERLKNERMEQLQALTKKTPQKALKQPQTSLFITYHVYNSNLIERYTSEECLYTLYELQHIEDLYPKEEGKINWDNWNRLVQQTKQKIEHDVK